MDVLPAHKVRIVRCPKCRLLLPEPADVAVYKCGGCSTVLQAKNRKQDAKRRSDDLHGPDAAQMNDSNCVSEFEDSVNNSLRASLASSDEHLVDQNTERDQDVNRDCTSEKFGGANSSSEDQNGGRYHNESQDRNIDHPGVSNEFCASSELARHANEGTPQSNGANSQVDVNDESSQLAGVKLADSGSETPRSLNTEIIVVTREDNPTVTYQRPAGDSVSSDVLISSPDEQPKQLQTKFEHDYDRVKSNASGENLGAEENVESSKLAEADSAVDTGTESDSTSRSSNAENIVVSPRSVGESNSCDVLISSPDEQPEQLQTKSEHGYDRLKSNASGENSGAEENGESSKLAEADSAVDISKESDSTSRSSNAENIVAPDQQPKQLQTNFKHGYESYDHVISNDALRANSDVEVHDKSSHLAEAKSAVDIKDVSDSTSRSSTESAVVTRENNSAVTSPGPAGESVSSDVVISSSDEQSKHLQTNSEHGYDRVRSNDAFGETSEVEVNDRSSQLVETKSAVDINSESDLTSRSSPESAVVARENNSTVTSHRPAGGSPSSDVLISSPDERPKQLQTSFKHGFDRIRSNDTFDSTSFFSPSSELSGIIDYMAKSPTTRSSHAYYDGSVSSFDGIDDQVHDQHLSSYRNPDKYVSPIVSEERSRRDKFLRNGNPEMRRQARIPSSVLSDERHYPLNHREWDRDELLDFTRRDQSVGNGMGFERDEFQSLASVHRRDYLPGYESGSTSSQLHDEFHNHPGEQEKIKLLRMVYELQDQLKRTGYASEKTSLRGSYEDTMKEKYVPAYFSHAIPEDEFSHELKYPRYPERYRRGSNWSHQYKHSRIPFSGEVTNDRHCIDSSCLHCYDQDWQRFAQLPPRIRSHSKGFCRLHPGRSCYSLHSSCHSSPQRFRDSEFPICYRETKSDDQRHEEYHVRRHMKEQPHVVKRHLRPTAGGAPFIICYSCLKLLQLPADFLLFKRRFHRLKCGDCSEVLKFSLENRIHIVPYTPKTEAPLQSEVVDFRDYAPKAEAPPRSAVVDYRDGINRRNSVSSHGNDYPQADPVSCSDDYGLSSHCKSYSTDGDPVIFTPFRNVPGDAHARNMSYDSLDSMNEGNQLVSRRSRNKNKIPVGSSRPGKVSSEIQELPGKTASPLHRLMGYNSPSQVIRGSDPSSSGTSSLHT